MINVVLRVVIEYENYPFFMHRKEWSKCIGYEVQHEIKIES